MCRWCKRLRITSRQACRRYRSPMRRGADASSCERLDVEMPPHSARCPGKLGPRAGLDANDKAITALAVRLEYGRLALAYVGPVFPESVHDIRLVRNDD